MSRTKNIIFFLNIILLLTSVNAQAETKAFKIGACDWSLKHKGEPDVFKLASEIGVDGVQISFGEPGTKYDLRKKENQELYLKLSKQYNVSIVSLGMGVLNQIPYKSAPETEAWVSESIDVAKAMGTDTVLLAFFAKNELLDDPEGIEEVIRRLQRIAPKAEKEGITFGLETYLDAETHLYIINKVGSPNIKVYYDVGNSFHKGYNIYKEIRQLGKENICEIHAKDWTWKPFGQGEIDFNKVREAIIDIQYNGWIVIEDSQKKPIVPTRFKQNRIFLQSLFNPSHAAALNPTGS